MEYAGERVVQVPLGDRSYQVRIGPGVRGRLPEVVARLGAERVAVVSARPRELLPELPARTLFVPARDGEDNKHLGWIQELCERFASFGLTRADLVVSCGGGTTTDSVGLAAALYHRGVPVVHLPTSLLAQVDASVGGKTAVNLPLAKNLVGTYWQPAEVLCDTDFLATLPAAERRNGYGEIARAHFIGAGDLRGLPVVDQIAASVARKAQIVAADERDTGLRHLLNYGHTLGHALERATGFALQHGEAVALGTVYAGRLAQAMGRIGAARAGEHADVVRYYGLPTDLPAGLRTAALIRLMRLDKKVRTAGLTFVLDGPQGAELVPDVPAGIAAVVLDAMPRADRIGAGTATGAAATAEAGTETGIEAGIEAGIDAGIEAGIDAGIGTGIAARAGAGNPGRSGRATVTAGWGGVSDAHQR